MSRSNMPKQAFIATFALLLFSLPLTGNAATETVTGATQASATSKVTAAEMKAAAAKKLADAKAAAANKATTAKPVHATAGAKTPVSKQPVDHKAAAVKKAADAKTTASKTPAATTNKAAEKTMTDGKAVATKAAVDVKKAVSKTAPDSKTAATKKVTDAKAAAENKKTAEAKQLAEAKKAAATKKQAETKKLADAKKAAAAQKLAEEKKAAEAKKAAEEKKIADAKRIAEEKRVAEEKRLAEEKVRLSQKPIFLRKHENIDVLPFSSFLPHKDTIARLEGSNDYLEATIPISKRATVQSISLHLVFSNSLSLTKTSSQLRFRFNGHLIGQIQLDPNLPEGVIDLQIPTKMVHAGFNTIRIESSLHTPENVSQTGSELWAEIDAQASKLTLKAKSRAIHPKFSNLPDLIRGAKWQGHYPLSVMLASDKPSDDFLNAASNAVQGIALLTEGLPVQVHTATAQWARNHNGKGALSRLYTPYGDADGILIGTYDVLQKILGKGVIDSTETDEQVLIRQHPLDPSSFILIVAGKTEADVLSASKHFSSMNMALANQNQIAFGKFNTLAGASSLAPNENTLQSMMRYNFAQLGIHNAEMKKAGDVIDLHLKMPADLFATQDNDVEIILHFAYTAGMGVGSTITVSLNGAFQRAIKIDDPRGLLIEDYRIKIPLRSFKKGENIIRMEANITLTTAARDSDVMRRQLKVSMYDDSIVRIPELNQYARLPDLNMLQETGYPYVEYQQSIIAIAKPSDSHYGAALTLVAKLAQLQNRPVQEVSLTAKSISNSKDSVLLLAALPEVKPAVWDASPFTAKDKGFLFPVTDPHKLQGIPHNALTAMVGFEQVIDAFVRKINNSSDLQYLDISGYGVLSQFESPWEPGSSLTLVMASNEDALLTAVYQLVDSHVWWTLEGDTVVWNLTDDYSKQRSYSLKLSDEYHTGTLNLMGKIAYYAITSPLYLILALIFLVAILTWLTRKLLILHHDDRDD